jgi:hypothetical protein
MQDLLALFIEAADLADLQYVVDSERGIMYIHALGEHGYLTCVGEALEAEHAAAFYTGITKAPPQRRHEAAEYLTRANWGLVIGNFELDMYEGNVRFKTSMVTGDTSVTPERVARLIIANLTTADHYLPGLLAVIYGNISAGDAIEQTDTFSLDDVLGTVNAELGD